eukprot:47372-Eustigmatos_ZCMA.PRE.1
MSSDTRTVIVYSRAQRASDMRSVLIEDSSHAYDEGWQDARQVQGRVRDILGLRDAGARGRA